jgi:hypothetical protein
LPFLENRNKKIIEPTEILYSSNSQAGIRKDIFRIQTHA